MAEAKDTFKFVVKRNGVIIWRDITNDLHKLATAWKARYPDCVITQIGRKTTWRAALMWKRQYEIRI